MVDIGESIEIVAQKIFIVTINKESKQVNKDGLAIQTFKREYLQQVLGNFK